MIRIEIWASGGGTNADAILEHFSRIEDISVVCIGCNRREAGAFKVAKKHNVNSIYWSKESWTASTISSQLKERQIDFIVLAGFLKLVPQEITREYQGRIVNIHPSLLPKYGGKNMYGHHVHEAVLENKESITGITIHEVNEEFDKGKLLSQYTTPLDVGTDDLASVQSKIQKLEHGNFPNVVEAWVRSKIT